MTPYRARGAGRSPCPPRYATRRAVRRLLDADPSPELRDLPGDVRVAALDVVRAVDDRDAAGDARGEQVREAGAQVRNPHRGPAQRRRPLDETAMRMVAVAITARAAAQARRVDLDRRAHLPELCRVAEPPLVDGFVDDRE